MNRSPITVLYIHASADLYGSDVCLLNLVKALPHQIRPIVLLPEMGPLAERLGSAGIDVRAVALPVPRRYYFHPRRIHRLAWLLYEMASSFRTIRRIIKSERVDIVHLNVSFLLFPAWVARLCGKPVVVHSREIYPKRRWTSLALRRIEDSADVIVCVSTAAQRQFSNQAKTAVLYDGLPSESSDKSGTVSRRELGLEDGVFCVGTVGRINYIKGHDVLIRAAHRVLSTFPNTYFLIVGDVYKKNVEIREELKRLAARLGISDRIVFTGFREDADRIIDLFDVFVLPSKEPESFGMVLLEAMVKSKPVVATAHGGPLDIVLPGETGFFVPPNDEVSLAERITELLANPQLREQMGRKGRERVLSVFRQDNLVQGMVSIYERLVNR